MAQSYKTLAQSNPSAVTLTDAYTVPALTETVISTIIVVNRSATPTTFRISIAVAGAADDDKQYLFYDATILGNETIPLTIGQSMATTDVLRVYAADATLSFNASGVEIT